jgi:hypothetical protein
VEKIPPACVKSVIKTQLNDNCVLYEHGKNNCCRKTVVENLMLAFINKEVGCRCD